MTPIVESRPANGYRLIVEKVAGTSAGRAQLFSPSGALLCSFIEESQDIAVDCAIGFLQEHGSRTDAAALRRHWNATKGSS